MAEPNTLFEYRFRPGQSGNPKGRPPRPIAERMRDLYIPEPNSGCWLWTSWVKPNGYGVFPMPDGKSRYAHRCMYELERGPIPRGMVIDHLCRVRSCVNPAHMEVVTNRENIRRGTSRSVTNAAMTHCVHGHEFTPENTLMRKGRFGRRCRACERTRWLANRATYEATRRAKGAK